MSSLRSLAAMCALLLLTQAKSECDPNKGPAGSLRCIRSSLYENQAQYATCLTNGYILQKSKGEHSCLNDNRYCFYQCMLDLYDKENGTVYSHCQCNQTAVPNTTLPSECYSPSGTDCEWYQNCLERKYKCSGGLDSYVMAFSEKLCALAAGNVAGITQGGLKWVNAASKCLQVELAPLLLPFENFACNDVSAHAYKKQATCYSNPYADEPGICTVSSADFWKIFWMIKDALGWNFVESLLGLLRTKSTCTGGAKLRLDPYMYFLKVRLQIPNLPRQKRDLHITSESLQVPFVLATRRARFLRTRRAATEGGWQGETSMQRVFHELANEAAQSMGRLLGWDEQEVIWFAYGSQTADPTIFDAQILLADRHAYGLQLHAWSPRENMTQVVMEAGQTVNRSDTIITVDCQKAVLRQLQACLDINCQQVVLSLSPASTLSQCRRRRR